ncbi:MAG: ribonuclease R [Actinomycetota bacterium]|nr:ribonuclease R [Actinomycetota bacterium]
MLRIIKRKGQRPLTQFELAEKLGSDLELLTIALEELESKGELTRTKKGKYTHLEGANLAVGVLKTNRRGYGFVLTEGPDIYISKDDMGGALNNDKVVVGLHGRRFKEGNIEGKVIRVIERANQTIVGTAVIQKKTTYVIPSDKKLFTKIIIDPKSEPRAEEGQIVLVKMERWPDKNMVSRGRIVELIGSRDDVGIEIEMIIREHNLATSFSEPALKETSGICGVISEEELAERRDFSRVFTVTIDGEDAKDFDDAVSVRRLEGGRFELMVHIADVSHYVSHGSHLDEEARSRGTSVYLVDRVIPMLPPRLSNDICSLNPDVLRLTFSVIMVVDHEGKVEQFEVVESFIKSQRRLTYRAVDDSLSSGVFQDEEVGFLIKTMAKLSDILEAKRLKRGSLNFETIEPKVILDEGLKPKSVVIREKTRATKIIEEAMILTNETVASFMHYLSHPMIYRVHEEPDYDLLLQLKELLKEFNYPVKGKVSHPKNLQKILDFASSRGEKLLINSLLLRAMKQAKYHPNCTPHFGLASKEYTHFTSPIRRYADLVVHRMIKDALKDGSQRAGLIELPNELGEICEHISVAEREAEDAERESVNVKLCELLSEQIGEVFMGSITGVTEFGIFVQLENSAEGLIHVKRMKDDFYVFDPDRFLLRGERLGKVYRLGEKLMVELISVDIPSRRIDFLVA